MIGARQLDKRRVRDLPSDPAALLSAYFTVPAAAGRSAALRQFRMMMVIMMGPPLGVRPFASIPLLPLGPRSRLLAGQ